MCLSGKKAYTDTNIRMSTEEVQDLVMILGASSELLKDLANKPETAGIFKKLFLQYSERAEWFQRDITEQYNTQHPQVIPPTTKKG